jgi:hypothetical protein
MTCIRRLVDQRGEIIDRLNPMVLELLSLVRGGQRVMCSNKLFLAAVIGLASINYSFPLSAWSAALSSTAPAQPGKIVAAGFGFEDAESSSITVKTYDADSGKVLSEDSYELDVKEDGTSASDRPRARIFAGGVGVGADGLSEFTLRVYDAENGRFLWEGRLNLVARDDADVTAQRVVAHVRSRAALTKVSRLTMTSGQPYFVLRAVNPETGQIMWGDQFFADTTNARIERISRTITGMPVTSPREIDFRIKMPDESGRQLLWEDQVVPVPGEDAPSAEQSDEAIGMLPIWPHGPHEGVTEDRI